MSTTLTITAAAPATTAEVAALGLAYMAAQSGVVTDTVEGSQVRTIYESFGALVEEQGTISAARAFQAIVYGAYAAFGIIPAGASAAVGAFTIATAPLGTTPVAASQAVAIPQGTLLQVGTGVQLMTTTTSTLAAGATGISVPVAAVLTGTTGNVASGTAATVVTALGYPLYAYNALPTAGGAAAETPAQTMTRFTAAVQAVGGCSPGAVANTLVGVTNPGTTEVVKFATCYEPWADPTSGVTTAQFIAYVDNGAGGASSGLLTAARAALSGNLATGQIGARAAGVPWSVVVVTPLLASVLVTATTLNPANITALSAAVTLAVTAYFMSLGFGVPAELGQILAAVTNVCAGYVSALNVELLNGSGASVTVLTPVVSITSGQRMLLTAVDNSMT